MPNFESLAKVYKDTDTSGDVTLDTFEPAVDRTKARACPANFPKLSDFTWEGDAFPFEVSSCPAVIKQGCPGSGSASRSASNSSSSSQSSDTSGSSSSKASRSTARARLVVDQAPRNRANPLAKTRLKAAHRPTARVLQDLTAKSSETEASSSSSDSSSASTSDSGRSSAFSQSEGAKSSGPSSDGESPSGSGSSASGSKKATSAILVSSNSASLRQSVGLLMLLCISMLLWSM